MPESWPSTADILKLRGPKNPVDEQRPYASFVEPEIGRCGNVADVATVLLSNKECPYKCLMCDLWKNTTDHTVSVGAIAQQIQWAIKQLPPARRIKLYNSGNFFDSKAIPIEDHALIASAVADFETVIIENHPRMTNDSCLPFKDAIDGRLEIAMGLESVHPEILPRLNKQMTLDDFSQAASFLGSHDIDIRTFILLRTPWQTEAEGIEWAIKALQFAFESGVNCCAVVPTRAGNGIMEQLAAADEFSSPTIASMETVMQAGLSLSSKFNGRVLMDLWDAKQFSQCDHCVTDRINRLQQMNLTQVFTRQVSCDYCK